MTAIDKIAEYKETIREVRLDEARTALKLAYAAADRVSGNRVKEMGAREIIEALEKHLRELSK